MSIRQWCSSSLPCVAGFLIHLPWSDRGHRSSSLPHLLRCQRRSTSEPSYQLHYRESRQQCSWVWSRWRVWKLFSTPDGEEKQAKSRKTLKSEAIQTLPQGLVPTFRDVNGVQISHLHREEASTDIDFQGLNIYNSEFPKDKKWLAILTFGPFPGTPGTGGCLLTTGLDKALVKKSEELALAKFHIWSDTWEACSVM